MNLFEGVKIDIAAALGFNPVWLVVGLVGFVVIVVLIPSTKKKASHSYSIYPTKEELRYYKRIRKSYSPKITFRKPKMRRYR